ncbi:MAG: hypothetical protein H6842_06390 [Rhodospirillaceae bacterium]|nr:hypothetical protein [Rhodospirillaceae bacterium]
MSFLLLFATAGIGNGSVFVIVPHVFRTLHRRGIEARTRQRRPKPSPTAISRRRSPSFTAGIAALGLFFIQRWWPCRSVTGLPGAALTAFPSSMPVCLAVTWFWYLRAGSGLRRAWNEIA